jgi:hypothetical protein
MHEVQFSLEAYTLLPIACVLLYCYVFNKNRVFHSWFASLAYQRIPFFFLPLFYHILLPPLS